MRPEYVVGSRVDGLYDGNNDDKWYSGHIQRINTASAANDDDDAATYEVLYDDGEIEFHVAPKFLRVHVSGTLCVGTRVFGRYAGGDEWYPGKVTEVQENGYYTIEYDDTEVETDVPIEFIKEPTEAVFEPATEPEVATAQADKDEGEVNGEEREHEIAANHVEDEADQEVATEAATPVPDEPEPVQVQHSLRLHAGDAVNDLQCEEAEDAVVVAKDFGFPVEIEPLSVYRESNGELQQTVEAVGVDSAVESGEGDLKADATSDATEAPPSAALEAEQRDADDNYSEGYGDENEFADAESDLKSDPNGKNPELLTDDESPASDENKDADTAVQDSSEETKETEQKSAEETVSASAVQEENASTSEDLDMPTVTAAEDSHPDAIESDSPLESVPPSAQSEGDQGNADEQTSSAEGEVSLEPETPETEEGQLKEVPASLDVLDSTGESTIDEPAYEDDYADDADQPREDAPSEEEPHMEEDSAAVNHIGAVEETSDAIDLERDITDRDESGVQVVDREQELAEAVLEPDLKSTADDTIPEPASADLMVSNEAEETGKIGNAHVDTGEDSKLDLGSPATGEKLESDDADASQPAPVESVEVAQDEQEPADEGYDDGEFEEGEASREKIEAGVEADPTATEGVVTSATETAADQSWEMLEAQALEADSSANIESETSTPVEEAGGADSTAGEATSPNAVEAETPQQQEREEATSANDQQGGDEATADDSSAVDSSGKDEAGVENIDGAPPITNSDDDVAELAVPQEEEEQKGVAPRESGVDDEKEESIEPERDATNAAESGVVADGSIQDDAQATGFPPDENEEVGKEVESVDVDAVPETTTALPTEREEGQSDMAGPGIANGSYDANETEAPLEGAPAPDELSKEGETQPSAPEFASYDDFEDQGDSEIPFPSMDEPTSSLEADVVGNDGVTVSPRVAVDDVVDGADQTEPPEESASIEESEPPQIVEDAADGGGDYEQEHVEKSEPPLSIEPDCLPSETGTESAEPPAVPSDRILVTENGDLSTEPATSVDEEAPQTQDQVDPVAENTELSEPEATGSNSTLIETEQPRPSESDNAGDAEVPEEPSEVDTPAPEANTSIEPEGEIVPPVETVADEPTEENADQLGSADNEAEYDDFED